MKQNGDNCKQPIAHPSKLRFGKFLCQLGFHDYRVLERNFQFGAGSGIEKVECRRCTMTITRQARS